MAPAHLGCPPCGLQGREAGRTERFWVGLSVYRPGGTAGADPGETIYVVLDGWWSPSTAPKPCWAARQRAPRQGERVDTQPHGSSGAAAGDRRAPGCRVADWFHRRR